MYNSRDASMSRTHAEALLSFSLRNENLLTPDNSSL
jgi:hypothetical protein